MSAEWQVALISAIDEAEVATETDTMTETLIDGRLSTVVIPRKWFDAASESIICPPPSSTMFSGWAFTRGTPAHKTVIATIALLASPNWETGRDRAKLTLPSSSAEQLRERKEDLT